MPFLSQLYLYPVKFMRPMPIVKLAIAPETLFGNESFILTKSDHTWLREDEYPLVLFTPVISSKDITLHAPDGQQYTAHYNEFTIIDETSSTVSTQNLYAYLAPTAMNIWLSQFFATAVKLRWLGPNNTQQYWLNQANFTSLIKEYTSLKLMNYSSFIYLQHRSPVILSLLQLRPNLIIENAIPFAEDQWETIKIGEVLFKVVQPYYQTNFSNVDIYTGHKQHHNEPLYTLQNFRVTEQQQIGFGIKLVAQNTGKIKRHDPIEVIEEHIPLQFFSLEEIIRRNTIKKITISFGQQLFEGNCQKTILEQLESQGIEIPYSCRIGICGQCKLRLNQGRVTPLIANALDINTRIILSCSCIPQSDLILSTDLK